MAASLSHRIPFALPCLYQYLNVKIGIGRNHAMDFFQSTILAMAFYEHNFHILGESRQSFDGRLNIVFLVPARDEYCNPVGIVRDISKGPDTNMILQAQLLNPGR